MTDTNLYNQLIEWLNKRGRWTRAGNNDLPRYLSIQLRCGPSRVSELVCLLREAPGELHVESEQGKIRMVGLTGWLDDDTKPTDEIPSELEAAWLMIGDLLADVTRSERAASDSEAAFALAAEMENIALGLRAQTTPSLPQPAASATDPNVEQELRERISELERQLTTKDEVLGSVRANYAASTRQARGLQDQNTELREQLRNAGPTLPPQIAALLEQLDMGHQSSIVVVHPS